MIDQSDNPNGVNKAPSNVNSTGGFSAPEISSRQWESPLAAAAYQQVMRDINKTTAKITAAQQIRDVAQSHLIATADAMRTRGMGELQLSGAPLESFVQAKVRPLAEDLVRSQNNLRDVRREEQLRIAPMAESRLVNSLRYATTPEYQGSVRAETLADPIQRSSAYALSRSKTITELKQQQMELASKREGLSQGLISALDDPTAPQNAATVDVNAAQLRSVYGEEAIVQRALQFKPDVTKTLESGRGLISRIGREQNASELAQDVKRGAVSTDDLRSQYAAAQKQLIESFKELDTAIQKNAENQDTLSEKFEQAKDIFSEKESAARKAGIDPTAPDAIGSRILAVITGGWGAVVQGLIAATREAAQTVQFAAVELPRQKAQVGTQFGEMVVGAYQDWRSVSKGVDVKAFARLSQFNEVAAASARARGISTGTGWTMYGADVAQGAIDTAATFAGADLVRGARQGAQVAGGAARGALAIDVNAAAQAVQTAQAARQAAEVLTAVPVAMSQTLMNSVSGSAYALRGTGARRDDILNAAMSQAGRARLTAAGIDMETMAPGLLAEATAGMGAQFTKANAVDLLAQAGTATRRGLVASESQFIGMAGQIAGVGGDPTSMGKLLREAVAAGLDSSKNISQMVSGISNLSAGAAQRGVDVTGTMQQYLSTGVQAATEAGIPKLLAEPMVEAAIAKTGDISQRAGFDLGTMQQMGMLKGKFPNLSMAGLNTLTRTSLGDLRALKRIADKDGEAAAVKAAGNMGLSVFVGENGKFDSGLLTTALDATLAKTVTNMGAPIGTPEQRQELMGVLSAGGKYSDLSRGTRIVVDSMAKNTDKNSMAIVSALGVASDPKQMEPNTNRGAAGVAERAMTTAAQQTNKVMESAAKTLGTTITGGFEKMSLAMQNFAKGMSPEKFSEMVQKSFTDMRLPDLGPAGDNIKNGAEIFAAAARLLGDRFGVKDVPGAAAQQPTGAKAPGKPPIAGDLYGAGIGVPQVKGAAPKSSSASGGW